jgi:hypothetical protein
MVQYLVKHGWFYTRVNACYSNMTTVCVNRKTVTTGCVRNHSVIQTKQTTTTRQEMSSIFKEMEANLVSIQHATQEIFATPQRSKYLRTWKWSVQENSHFCHWNLASKKGRKDEEMKSMDPNKITFIETLNDHIRKLSVDCCIRRPESCLATTVPMNRTLGNIVLCVFRKI